MVYYFDAAEAFSTDHFFVTQQLTFQVDFYAE